MSINVMGSSLSLMFKKCNECIGMTNPCDRQPERRHSHRHTGDPLHTQSGSRVWKGRLDIQEDFTGHEYDHECRQRPQNRTKKCQALAIIRNLACRAEG